MKLSFTRILIDQILPYYPSAPSAALIGFLFHFVLILRFYSVLTFKAIHELAPFYINDLVKIKPLNSRYRLRSNEGILLSRPNFKTLPTLSDRAFVAAAPKLWNDLPLEIGMAANLLTL